MVHKRRVCQNCGKVFYKGRSDKKYCSVECKRVYRNRIRRKKPTKCKCPHCGKVFYKKRSDKIFCSRRCASRNWEKTHPERFRKNLNKRKKRWKKEHPKRYREIVYEATKRYRRKNPKIHKAQVAAENIEVADECELCPDDDKRTENLQKHHPDYDYPLIIVTVCPECHRWLHHG